MTDCIFCKIVAAEIPASIVYEDEDVLAFLDIRPFNHGHVLVVSKEHVRNLLDAHEDVLQKLITASQKIARGITTAFGADGITLKMNSERAGGQDVFHIHIHIVPRYENDGLFPPTQHKTYEGNEMNEVATKIKNAIA